MAFVLLEFAIIPRTVAIYGTNLPATPLTKATPADRGLVYDNVTFTTSDHARLSAWYLPTGNGAAVTWLAARSDVTAGRIGAVGLSMGGEEAISASSTAPCPCPRSRSSRSGWEAIRSPLQGLS